MKPNSPLSIVKKISEMLLPVCKEEQLAHQEAWWMLEKLTSKKRVLIILEKTLELTKDQRQLLSSWLKERTINKKPLQYILGSVPFCDLEILVKPPTLIPRPETEEWCSWLISKIKKVGTAGQSSPIKILDIGSGSGAISLSLASAIPSSKVLGVDIDEKAMSLSKENKDHNKLNNAFFGISNIYSALDEQKNKFDIIVSNPPYLSTKEWLSLDTQVKDWEDAKALTSGITGFEIYEKIIKEAPFFIQKNSILRENDVPQIVLEIGSWQGKRIKELLEKNGFCNIQIHKDLENKDRWVSANLS